MSWVANVQRASAQQRALHARVVIISHVKIGGAQTHREAASSFVALLDPAYTHPFGTVTVLPIHELAAEDMLMPGSGQVSLHRAAGHTCDTGYTAKAIYQHRHQQAQSLVLALADPDLASASAGPTTSLCYTLYKQVLPAAQSICC